MFIYFTSEIPEDKNERIKCLYSSFCVSVCLFVYEILQIRSDIKEYLKDVWNWVDITGFITFWMLCYINLVLNENTPLKEFEVFLSLFVVLQMFLKFNYFLRVYDKFGLLVTLITTCMKDIVPFTIYFIFWETTFVLLYTVVGIIAPERVGLKRFNLMFVYVFENSLGNINDPDDYTFTQGYPQA